MKPQTARLVSMFILALLLIPAAAGAAPTMEMAKVKGGCFQMGDTFGDGVADEKPAHKVCLKDFSIGTFEVTQAQWREVMGNNPSAFAGDKRPVEQVSWQDVQQFLAKLQKLTGIAYRLPTEAEWEYAARSGARQEKWAGTSDEKQVSDVAWHDTNSRDKTQDVGTRKPNDLGIFDMTGNVAEWCQDGYMEGAYAKARENDPVVSESGNFRVIRGGAWMDDAWSSRAIRRGTRTAAYRASYLGFRLAVSGQ